MTAGDIATFDAAIGYAEAGWPVFPVHSVQNGQCTCGNPACQNIAKHPRTAHGVLDASADIEQIATWWRQWPDSNIGIATGAAHLAVVDVDIRGDGVNHMGELELPTTRTVQTGGGGLHLYYLGTAKAQTLAGGIHLKSDGGYVVAPPSLHASGERYRWLNEEQPLAEMPKALCNDKVPSTPLGHVIEPDQKRWVADLLTHECPEGQRDNTLARLAGYFRNLLPEGVTQVLLANWNQERCQPPLAADQVRRNVHHKYSRYEAILDAKATAEQEDEARPRYVLHWIAEALGEDDPIPWVVNGILSRGSVTLVYGKPGAKKTYLCQDMAVHVAAGVDWLGHEIRQGPVLMIDEESGPRRLKRRFREVMRGHGFTQPLPVGWTTLERFTLGNNSGDLAALDTLLAEVKPAVVIMDALVDITGGADENDAKQMQAVMQDLRFLADRHQCAIVMIHHSAKAGGYRGSSAILGAVDLALEIMSERDSSSVDARAEKSRDTEPFQFAAGFYYDQVRLTVDFQPSQPVKAEPRHSRSESFVIRYLTEHGSTSISDLQTHADTCSEMAARRAIYSLAEKRIIERSDGGKSGEKATYRLMGGDL